MITIRRMCTAEIERIEEIDRSEQVKQIYVNRNGTPIRKDVNWLISQWPPPEMVIWRQMLAAGGTWYGAFDGQTLIGFSIYRPNLSQDTAQLAALYVSKDYRRRKVGGMLLEKAAEMARTDGAKKLYVSATPTTKTVDFYMSKGFHLTEEINKHLYELEPEDIHMIKNL